MRTDVYTGEDVPVLGTSSGIGHVVIQSARHATAFACTSSERKAQQLRDLSADRVVDYTSTDFA